MSDSTHDAHARFRFSVIGALLSSPPRKGELQSRLKELADRTWKHPLTGEPRRYGFQTIERWFYIARSADNPVRALRRRIRKDVGRRRSISAAFDQAARAQYSRDPDWSRQLHYDNLRVLCQSDVTLGPPPSYPSFVRYMNSIGLPRRKRRRTSRPGRERSRAVFEERETRSFEADYVGALWHLDFHTSSIPVLTSSGSWKKPDLFAVLDDHSRLCCHAQFYFSETTEDLVHGFSQALLKRGLPRELMSDNGSAMLAGEFTQGLSRLSIEHQTTLAYCPEQNGKQEHFWAVVEGRLMAMLRRVCDLSLERLNLALQAWVEQGYHRSIHSEIHTTPLDRYRNSASDVSRPPPEIDTLRDVFRVQVPRKQRQSDGTFTLPGVRFEVPSRYRQLRDLSVRYARWDLGYVHLVDPRTDTLLARVFPLDRSKNASGQRRRIEQSTVPDHQATIDSEELPPLLEKYLQDYAATGLPPSYLPKVARHGGDEDSTRAEERTN